MLLRNKIKKRKKEKGKKKVKEKIKRKRKKVLDLKKFKNLATFAFDLKKKLKPIHLKFPNIVLSKYDTDEIMTKIGDLSFTPHLKNKRI
mmetsp:Transcript_16779/g.14714  ORF Transcript_16779/g.14714 Transcript_16779/m.14714 type:complete len:89 (+) Transcript_16779:611-877(+)